MVSSPMQSRLGEVGVGREVQVVRSEAEGIVGRRLLDLGLVPGTTVRVLRVSPLGDPKAYLIRGAVIALRDTDARQVLVKGVE